MVSNHEESEQEESDNSSQLPFDFVSPLDASPDDFPVATEVPNGTVV